MHLDFMTPDIWNGLVIGTILIGVSLAILRLMSDWAVHKKRSTRPPGNNDNRRTSTSFAKSPTG